MHWEPIGSQPESEKKKETARRFRKKTFPHPSKKQKPGPTNRPLWVLKWSQCWTRAKLPRIFLVDETPAQRDFRKTPAATGYRPKGDLYSRSTAREAKFRDRKTRSRYDRLEINEVHPHDASTLWPKIKTILLNNEWFTKLNFLASWQSSSLPHFFDQSFSEGWEIPSTETLTVPSWCRVLTELGQDKASAM